MKRGLSGIIPINTGTGVRGHLGSRHHRLRFWQKKGGGSGAKRRVKIMYFSGKGEQKKRNSMKLSYTVLHQKKALSIFLALSTSRPKKCENILFFFFGWVDHFSEISPTQGMPALKILFSY